MRKTLALAGVTLAAVATLGGGYLLGHSTTPAAAPTATVQAAPTSAQSATDALADMLTPPTLATTVEITGDSPLIAFEAGVHIAPGHYVTGDQTAGMQAWNSIAPNVLVRPSAPYFGRLDIDVREGDIFYPGEARWVRIHDVQ